MVLNMLSTASMIRIGKSYKNLMVDVRASNQKLVARGIRIIMQVTAVDEKQAEQALQLADQEVKLALMMLLTDTDKDEAKGYLEKAKGFLRQAIQSYNQKP